MSDTMLSFGPGGPRGIAGGLPTLAPDNRKKRTSDGKGIECQRYYLWYMPPDQELPRGVTYQEAHDWVKWVLQHSKGWARAGVWFGEATKPLFAHFLFMYVDPPVRCGSVARATACSSGGLIRYSNTNIGDPNGNTWYSRGVLHEAAHEAFNAKHDGDGIMRVDGSNVGIRWPTDNDIAAVRRTYVGRQ